jgi:hypothetical protein
MKTHQRKYSKKDNKDMADKAAEKRMQIELSAKLQTMILLDFERMLKENTMSPSDRATLVRLLSMNGWSLDPAMIPQGLRGVLTAVVDPKKLDDEEEAA